MDDMDKLIFQTNRSRLQLIRQKYKEIEEIGDSIECQSLAVGCPGCIFYYDRDCVRLQLEIIRWLSDEDFQSWIKRKQIEQN